MSPPLDPTLLPAVKRWSVPRLLITVILSITAWAVVAILCLCFGSTTRGFSWPTHDQLPYRSEDVLLASLVGAALASAGVVYQAILRNPLADPYLLGVSSGASLAAFIWRFAWKGALVATLASAASQQAFALAGGLIAVSIVFSLATRRGRLEPVTLLLVGVIVNAVNGSIFLLINTIMQDLTAGTGGQLVFLVGSIQRNLSAGQKWSTTAVVAACWIALLYLSGQLNIATLSEAEAQSLGVRIHRLRWICLVLASLITAAVVAISGPIGFVGLVCPHLARLVVGTDQRKLLPAATAVGAIMLSIAETFSHVLSRVDMAGTLLPVGVLTGLLGGPFFLILLWRAPKRGSIG